MVVLIVGWQLRVRQVEHHERGESTARLRYGRQDLAVVSEDVVRWQILGAAHWPASTSKLISGQVGPGSLPAGRSPFYAFETMAWN